MDRAYSLLINKAVSEDADFVHIEGIASTPTPDRTEDIVEPMGAEFTTPMKLLLYHLANFPVGNVTFARPNPKGIPFRASLPRIKELGRVKDRVDEAIHSLQYDLISAVSIGFKPIEGAVEQLKSGGLRFKRWLWLELSLVAIPAQPEAVITSVKSLSEAGDQPALPNSLIRAIKSADTQALAAIGQKRSGVPLILRNRPGVSGKASAAHRGSVLLIPKAKS